jgi:triosephosphate isomerase
MALPSVDGVLVGGASLQPEAFARIVTFAASSP